MMKLKVHHQVKYIYSYSNSVRDSNLFEQTEDLDVKFHEIRDEKSLEWYIYQLRYYEGPDLNNRFEEVFANLAGQEMLIKNFMLFKYRPELQVKIIEIILSRNMFNEIKILANGVFYITDDLMSKYLKILLLWKDSDIIDTVKYNILYGSTTSELCMFFLTLIEDERFSETAHELLIKYLMPSFPEEEEEANNFKEMVLDRWFEFIHANDYFRALVWDKFQMYKEQENLPYFASGNTLKLENMRLRLRNALICDIAKLFDECNEK
jgi:hypothetical protein